MNLLMILAVLALALLITIPLLEKYAKPVSAESANRLSRWVMPLIALLLLMQLLYYWFG